MKYVVENLSQRCWNNYFNQCFPFTTQKNERDLVATQRVNETKLPLIYLNRTGGQDELIFDGSSVGLNSNGNKFFSSLEFEEQISIIEFNKENEIWKGKGKTESKFSEQESLYKALVVGLRDYVNNNNFRGVLLGLSIDHIVAAIATAFDQFRWRLCYLVHILEMKANAKKAASLLNINYSNLKINEAMKIIEKILGEFNDLNLLKALLRKIFNQD